MASRVYIVEQARDHNPPSAGALLPWKLQSRSSVCDGLIPPMGFVIWLPKGPIREASDITEHDQHGISSGSDRKALVNLLQS